MTLPTSFHARLLASVVALSVPNLAFAGTLYAVWPAVGGGSCSSTLQACIDESPDGSIILIATETPIDENITLANRSQTLAAYEGMRPRFAAGRNLVSTSTNGLDVSVRLRGLGFTNGFASHACGAGATVTLEMRDLSLMRLAGGTPAYLAVQAGTACTVNATIEGNRIDGWPAGINSGLVHLGAFAGTLNAYVAHNRITRTDATTAEGAGILVDIASSTGSATSGTGTLRVFANQVRGAYGRAAIYFSEGLAGSAPGTLTATAINNVVTCGGNPSTGTGIGHVAGSGTIAALAVNNTIAGCVRGISALRWSSGTPASRIGGYVWNNLVDARTQGFTFTADLTPDLDNDYNLINAPSLANVALGTHTLSVPARLVADSAPRLRADSPAIDAADSLFLANALIDSGLPLTDADGLRRSKGAGTDIGAYEAGDVSALHVASAANAVLDHVSAIDLAATNGQAAARVHATRNFGTSGPYSAEPFGVYYTASRWALYHETIAAVAPGLKWSVFVPGAGAGVFTHAGSAANTVDWRTTIDNPSTNGQASRIVLATHNWTAQPTYIAHPLVVHFSGSGAGGRWNIGTADRSALPAASAFNVYAQPPSPNAFRLFAATGSNRVVIDHPLVNDESCAVIHATRVVADTTAPTADGFDIDYSAGTGRWGLFSVTPYAAGTAFNIVIDPAQVFDCTDRIFANGFD